jgi:septum formation protein
MKVILASTSAIRSAILSRAGIAHTVVRPAADEELLKASFASLPPAPLSLALAREKALSISMAYHDDLVIGADQVLVCDGQLFNKPANMEDARSQLLRLRGRPHQLISSLSVCQDRSQKWSATDTATLWMREFSDEFLASYLESTGSDVTTSVGAYKVEAPGIQLFDKIDGDHNTILGMPLLPLLGYLRGTGAIAT